MKIYIIAEAGVNHNGSAETAMKMIDAAKVCGCDCIKFQTFRTEDLVTMNAQKAEYQIQNTGNTESQYAMLKRLELDDEDFRRLKRHCEEIGIDFLSTPFDRASADFLETLSVSRYKMSSGDITNKPLLEYIAAKQKPMILSTGMCTLEEVREAVQWIESQGNHQISLLHCTSAYPTPFEDVNLNAMLTLKRNFPYPVGYSDHTKGIWIPAAAAALGAQIIEKHFTLDKTMPGPDHAASLDVEELRQMVKAVRITELSMGDGIKKPSEQEYNTRTAARKSIVSVHAMKAGQILQYEDMTIKRPGTGIPPKYLENLIGRELVCDIGADCLILEEHLK